MAVSIRQLHDIFVGEVSGIDISKPLSREEVAALEAGMDLPGEVQARLVGFDDRMGALAGHR